MTTAFVSSTSSMLDPGNEFNQVSVELGEGELQHNAPSQNQLHKSSSRQCIDYRIWDQKVDLDSGKQSGFFQFKQ
jgi:hypothetical protein